MNSIKITLVVATLLILATQIWAKTYMNTIETHPYSVIKQYDGFEIRKYKPALFSYVTIDADTYDEASGTGFRQLANYIFGGNDRKEEIAMTSPVEMEMESQITMKFLVPAKYKLADLPKPNNPNVKFEEEGEKTVAAIRFGGYADDQKIKYFKELLVKLLENEKINHSNDFSFLGYNSPFDFFNRRNEIIVEVEI